MSELVIDVRKTLDSGIGTYIRNVVPKVVRRLAHRRLILLLDNCSAQKQREALQIEETPNISWMAADARPFGVQEQLELRRILAGGRAFWATSLAHPLFWRGTLIATVHDVVQLALDYGSGDWLRRSVARVFFQSMHRRASVLFMISDFTRREYERHVGVLHRREVFVTLPGVDKSWFQASAHPRHKELPPCYFLVVGDLRPNKNVRRILQAFCQVMDRVPEDLVIVGRHEGFRTADPGIVDVIRASGPRIRFLGALEESSLKSAMANSDALIFPSLYEGFGSPVAEAAAAGTIVVTSHTGATDAVCGNAAFFVEPTSVSSIAEAMLQVATLDGRERKTRITEAIARAEKLSWDESARVTADAIERFCFCDVDNQAAEFPVAGEHWRDETVVKRTGGRK